MSKKQLIKAELIDLYNSGAGVLNDFQDQKYDHFQYNYQSWYTKAIRAVQNLAPDRLIEFRSYYEIDPKRKALGYGTYVIQDYFKGVAPNKFNHPEFNTKAQVVQSFFNQLTIFKSVMDRADSLLGNIEEELYAEIQDSEIAVAKQLIKVSVRAAGALMGVVIEGHLQKVAESHSLKVAKKNPTISDLNDPLKNANIIDTPTWRKITYLADLRNLAPIKKMRNLQRTKYRN
ncbi:hypothetical protein [Pseudomonas mercuritolerans]|uniref:Uncharacterized protein n=1 Tax=Pseudomonas mercuritolerans TaxID=2951809 RepID=A0ABT2XP92_9PSED|nr:hypothetical protein [Pseudomonas mercuritolerans]MCV2220520.1 hypothetical protein [Pseudomonas mercuritolerans]